MIYFTGCTHFGHENIIRLANRPFSSSEEMDEVMIENWNKTVKPSDVVWHLGDFAWFNHLDYLGKLKGQIHFIQGNHDPNVWISEIYKEFSHKKRGFVLMHYPIEEWNGWWKSHIHTHCHTHKSELASAPRRFNVGVDATNFTPISIDEILEHPNAEKRDYKGWQGPNQKD